MYPSYHVQSLKLWSSVYLSNNSSRTSSEDLSIDKGEQEPCPSCNLQKTRSCENLLANQEAPVPSPSRRKSDPSIALDNFDQVAHLAKEVDKSPPLKSDLREGEDIGDKIDSKVSQNIPSVNGHNSSSNELELNENVKNLENQTIMNGHTDTILDCDDRLINNVPNGHMNGSVTESDNENSSSSPRPIVKNNSEKMLCDKNGIESSTDTLVEDENELSKINGRLKNVSRSVENLIPAKKPVDRLKSLENSSTISTSTSEISSSSIELALSDSDNLQNLQRLLHQSNSLKLSCKTNGCVKQLSNGTLSPNKCYTTPVSSRTPNSTCPPTPGADSKVGIFKKQNCFRPRLQKKIPTDILYIVDVF